MRSMCRFCLIWILTLTATALPADDTNAFSFNALDLARSGECGYFGSSATIIKANDLEYWATSARCNVNGKPRGYTFACAREPGEIAPPDIKTCVARIEQDGLRLTIAVIAPVADIQNPTVKCAYTQKALSAVSYREGAGYPPYCASTYSCTDLQDRPLRQPTPMVACRPLGTMAVKGLPGRFPACPKINSCLAHNLSIGTAPLKVAHHEPQEQGDRTPYPHLTSNQEPPSATAHEHTASGI